MPVEKDFYTWYKESIIPEITDLKEKLKERNPDMEFVFIISEPNKEATVAATGVDYSCKVCNLTKAVAQLIESELNMKDINATSH